MKKILIIEDTPLQRAILENIVKELNFTPVSATKFDHSLYSLLDDTEIVGVLLDLILVDEDGNIIADGMQICQEIREKHPLIKILVISAENDETAKTFAQIQGADGYLTKPFQVSDLEAHLSDLMSTST